MQGFREQKQKQKQNNKLSQVAIAIDSKFATWDARRCARRSGLYSDTAYRFPFRFGYLGDWWAFTSDFDHIFTAYAQELLFLKFTRRH